MAQFSGSYDPADVTFLLKPAEIATVDVAAKEELIQSGARHYSEMLSAEKLPDARYMALYHAALTRNGGRLRADIATLADTLIARPATAHSCTIISLARAGTPMGVLLRRELARRGVDVAHFSISIIRGRGIDEVALAHIRDARGTTDAVFLDGWTGKGAIAGELRRSLDRSTLGFAPFLAVVADPAGCADLAATSEDYLIPSGLLNGIVSGLVSRSVLSDTLVGPGDFHACRFMQDLAEHDLSRAFVDAIEDAPLPDAPLPDAPASGWSAEAARLSAGQCARLLAALRVELGVNDINRIKPGIAEATRAILRRVPDAVLVRDPADPEIAHILHLAEQTGLPIVSRELHNYRAVSIIKRAKDR